MPRIARSASGKMLLTYNRTSPNWQICYREVTNGGIWSAIETIGAAGFNTRPDVIEDSLGRPHVFYTGVVGSEKGDVYEAVKINGSWQTTNLSNDANNYEDYARAAIDSLGRIHLVYTKGSVDSRGSVVYRVWNGSSWSGETAIGTISYSFYYHRPNISVDPNGNIHVVWCGSSTSLNYRKCTGGAWGAIQTVGTTSNFFSYPCIAAVSANDVLIATVADSIYYTYSSDGGASWSAYTYLCGGHYPNIDVGPNSTAHFAYQTSNSSYIGYRTWTPAGGWGAQQYVSPSTGGWKGWPDVSIDINGYLHIVWDCGATNYTTNLPDTVPPSPIVTLAGSIADSGATLYWTNPADVDFAGCMIRYKTNGYPTSPADGTLVCNRTAAPGSSDSYSHTGLTNGTTYYYSAFAYDTSGNYASARTVSVTPDRLSCEVVKDYIDGTKVSINGKVITAIYSTFGAIYVSEKDRSSGIRVATSGSGYAVGDEVNISGTMASRTGAFERYINVPTLTKISSGNTIKPIAMGVKSVVGGSRPPYVVGAQDIYGNAATGPNNIGLLVRIAGRVTYKSGAYLLVDDGSGYEGSYDGIGVMVQCINTSVPANEGDFVVLTGIAAGSAPSGWTKNRRFVLMRGPDYSEMQIFSNTGTLAGTVKNAWNEAVSGATVSTDSGGYSATTSSAGAYAMSSVVPGTYSITAAASGYASKTVSGVSVEKNQTATTDFTLNSSFGRITGYIRNASNSPIAGATVVTNTGGYSATTASDGSFKITNVAPGSYSITASATGYVAQASPSFSVVADQSASTSLNLAQAVGTISGVIVDTGGSPVSGVLVATSTGGYSATTGTNGAYAIANVVVGAYSVTASKTGYQSQTVSSVSVNLNQVTTLNFTMSSVPVEKATNGDMESGFFSTGWATTCSGLTSKLPNGWGWNNESGVPFNTFESTSTKHGGSYALGFAFCQTAASPGKIGVAKQNVNLGAANATATFTVWAYHNNGNCPSVMAWNPGFDESVTTAYNSLRYQWVTTDNWGQLNTWVTRSMTVTADSTGYVTIFVGGAAHSGTTSGSKVYIDDVSVL